MNRCVVFIHIPKCAGTTLCTRLAAPLGPRVFWHGFHGDVSEAIRELGAREMVRRFDLIAGHFTSGMVEALFTRGGGEIMLAALLREPMEQVRSYFQWISQVESHPYHQRCRNRTLTEAVADPLLRDELRDIQTRYLVGWGEEADPEPNLRSLAVSKANLALATTRKIPELIRLIEAFLGCGGDRPTPCGTERLNVTPQPFLLNGRDAEIAASLTRRDSVLYQDLEGGHAGMIRHLADKACLAGFAPRCGWPST